MQYEEVKELIEIFEKTDLNDMEVQLGDERIRLNRGTVSQWMSTPPIPPAAVPAAAPSAAVPASQSGKLEENGQTAEQSAREAAESGSADKGTKVIKAPIVGTFYQSSAPDEAPFVKVGDTVSEGDVVCIIEAMKFMNEVNSDVSGTVTEILVKDGEFVEYGQELFRIK